VRCSFTNTGSSVSTRTSGSELAEAYLAGAERIASAIDQHRAAVESNTEVWRQVVISMARAGPGPSGQRRVEEGEGTLSGGDDESGEESGSGEGEGEDEGENQSGEEADSA
jgi:hypothetical protein